MTSINTKPWSSDRSWSEVAWELAGLRNYLIALAGATVATAASLASTKLAEAGCVNGPYYGYPAFYEYYGIALPTFYYQGFYGPRVVFAPCIYRSRHAPNGYWVRYQNVRRSW